MFLSCVRPEELCITNEEISKQIRNNGDKEWRSYSEFLSYLDSNYQSIDWKVIGWVSNKTTMKWFNWSKQDTRTLWILVRGKQYWLVDTFCLT